MTRSGRSGTLSHPCPSDWACDPQTQTCTRSITPVDHPTNAQCPYLGASANQSQLLLGTLDSVRLYTRALSAQDVAQLHANGG